MKLSEAIRLGAMMDPQGFGALHDGHGTCAFGAAGRACGQVYDGYTWTDNFQPKEWEWVNAIGGKCPACGDEVKLFASIISEHLNDAHKWPRERIADVVETIEQQLEAQATPQLEVEHVTY